MIKADLKIIRKWSKNRQPINGDWKGLEDAGLTLYNSLDDRDKGLFIKELKDYNESVKSGRIIPNPVKLKITKYARP